MKVKIREVVDIDSSVDLSKLSTMQKITVSLRDFYRNLSIYKKRRERELERKYREKVDREERLKDMLLMHIYRELVKNEEMGKRGMTCSKIVLSIDRNFEKDLKEVIRHKDFISYNMRILDCDPDLLRSYSNIPVHLEVSMKVIGGGTSES